jgi:hypothetical protein
MSAAASATLTAAAQRLDAVVGRTARALLDQQPQPQPQQPPQQQQPPRGAAAPSECWSFCAAPPLEAYTGGWLDERAAPPAGGAPARSRPQAII